jgi:hypothetical protein
MSTVRSLEQERQAILDRMQLRREAYRRMLAGGEDFQMVTASRGDKPNGSAYAGNGGETAGTTVYTYTQVPDAFPRSRMMQVVSRHPLLCALGVAAVLAIGPRRIVRSVSTSRLALGAIAADPSRLNMIGRVLELAGTYAKRRGG